MVAVVLVVCQWMMDQRPIEDIKVVPFGPDFESTELTAGGPSKTVEQRVRSDKDLKAIDVMALSKLTSVDQKNVVRWADSWLKGNVNDD